jgi:gamma-polyglutamate biosynthesis protein CapA
VIKIHKNPFRFILPIFSENGEVHACTTEWRRAGRAIFGAGLRLAPACLLLLLAACRAQPGVTLAFLGDISLGRDVHPTPTSLEVIQPELQSADLALANLESPLAETLPETAGQGYNLCAPAGNAALLAGWGLDILSIANNHSYNCGMHGPVDTASILANNGHASIGLGTQPYTAQLHGLPLAFLAFDDVTAPVEVETAVVAIQSARQTGSIVIVSVHWGVEYQGGASQRQKDLAAQFAEAGASIIWGHHPHVLQPAEWIETTYGRTLVLYSLGNALFDQGGLADTRQSALVLVGLDGGGVVSVRAVPFEIDIVNSRLVEPDAGTAQGILDRLELRN